MVNNLNKNEINMHFINAVKQHNWEYAEKMLDKGADINMPLYSKGSMKGRTALAYAVAGNRKKAVSMLLAHGADPNITDEEGVAPLHESVIHGHTVIFDMLVAAGADIRKKNAKNETVLFMAVNNGQPYFVKELLQKGVPITDDPELLHRAAYRGDKEIVEILINAGCDPNLQDKVFNTPLCYAASEGYMHIIELLISAGADVNLRRNNKSGPLHKAVIYNRITSAEILLKNGADPNSSVNSDFFKQNLSGSNGNVLCSMLTPLQLAYMESSADMFDLLIRYGADPSAVCGITGTLAHIVAADGDLNMLKKLCDAGADMTIENSVGQTPAAILQVHWPAQFPEFIRYIEHKAREARLREEDSILGRSKVPDFDI